MKNLLQVWRETEEKLGRRLEERERTFLQHVHERYLEEQHKKVSHGEKVIH